MIANFHDRLICTSKYSSVLGEPFTSGVHSVADRDAVKNLHSGLF